MAAATAVQLACHCGLIREPASLLSSQHFPVECGLCHCDTCRYQTGALGTSYVDLNGRPSQESLRNATPYETPLYKRYFCKGCGCNVFAVPKSEEGWLACAGIVEIDSSKSSPPTKNTATVTHHDYVGDPKDGGIAPYLTQIGGKQVPCYWTEPGKDDAGPIGESDLQQLRERASSSF